MTDAKKIANKIKSNKDFKRQCAKFFELALGKIWDRKTTLRRKRFPFMRNSIIFHADDDLFSSAINLGTLCVEKLGPKFGDENDVDKLIWKHTCDGALSGTSPETIADEFLKSLVEHAQSASTYVCANQLFRFHSNTHRLEIGSVEIVAVTNPTQDIFDGKVNPSWVLSVGQEYAFSENENIKIQIPTTCWKVSAHASQSNVKEEAEWLIDVAISFFRVSQYELLRSASNGLFPEIGKTEPLPTRIPESETQYLLMTENGISAGGVWVPPMYVIDDAVIAATQTPEFKAKAQAIFFPVQGSLAERFGQGLGWLTRGRQSEDRAERILFFFTAIESLLSNDGMRAPVVQNIARSAAAILTNDVADRAKNAAKIKSLYGMRSALVHAGKRNVSKKEANTAQVIAETLYMSVLEHVSLTVSFSTFQAGLGQATYGLPWPKVD